MWSVPDGPYPQLALFPPLRPSPPQSLQSPHQASDQRSLSMVLNPEALSGSSVRSTQSRW